MHILLVLLLASPALAATVYVGDSISCVVYAKGEVRRDFGLKNSTGFVCTNQLTGEVLGSLNRAKNGAAICPVAGAAFNDRCATIDICADGDFSDSRDVCVP